VTEPDLEEDIAVPLGIDLRASFIMQRVGRNDPTARLEESRFVKAARTAEGPVTVEITMASGGRHARVRAWGEGAAYAMARAAAWLGDDDGLASFAPPPGLVATIHKDHRTLRLPRSPFPHEVHAAFILQQRVTWAEAAGQYGRLARDYGEDAPGPHALRLFPDRKVLAGLPRHVYLGMGIDSKRGGALVEAMRLAFRVDALASRDEARAYLSKIPGTGPWTTENVLASGFGDPDAVSPGDVNLPHMVCFALAGDEHGSDERMFELLEPYRGHRNRAVRLLFLGGPTRPYIDRGLNRSIAHRPGRPSSPAKRSR
jgi:3-methyladenine DNA glycosylase/8-oxoguanine DNA glycosylase